MKRLSLALIAAVALFSCAQRAVQKEAPPEPAGQPAEQELVLPEVTLEPKKEEKKPEAPKQAVVVEKTGEEKYVILNFDDADIDTVISTMGDLLQINYILAPGISGKVTIQSYKKFPVKDLFSIFQSILEMNGLTAVQNKDFYTIMPVDSAKQQPLDVEKGKEIKMKLDSGFITQIVPLEFVKASDATNLLRGLMPRGTDLIVYEPTNLLIVTARPEGLIKFMKIMEAIDIPTTERENIKTFVYFVESGEAKKLVEILKDLYAPKGAAKKTGGPTPQPRPPVSPPGTTTPQGQPASSTVVGGTAAELEGEITITAYEDINAIIIKASASAYLALVETIKKLDIAPKQVLIEVLIVELTLNDTESLGIEWILRASGDPTAIGGYNAKNVTVPTDTSKSGFLQPTLANVPTGYFAAIIDPGKFIGIINAFASYGKTNVISSPHILALDNKEAKIEVGDEIPIATGVNTQTGGTTTGTGYISTGQIQYKTTGTLLTVTPHISDKDNVTLKVSQEFSVLGASVSVGGTDFPSFSTRRAQTTGIVKDGHTLVIGGMIREDDGLTKGGFPFLSKIPVLGYLFGSTSRTMKRTELVVLVTPHVVRDQEEADRATKEFQEKVRSIKETIEEVERANKERKLKKSDEQGKG